MNVLEKGIPKPPEDMSFIGDPGLRAGWLQWIAKVWNHYPRVRSYGPALTPAAVNAASESVQTFAVVGVTAADVLTVNKPTNQSDLDLVHAWVSAADVVSLKYRNYSGSPITPSAETYRIVAVRQ